MRPIGHGIHGAALATCVLMGGTPEIGASQAIGHGTPEGAAAATLHTDSGDCFGGNTGSRGPLFSLRGHVIHGFGTGIWGSADATYFAGGRIHRKRLRSDRRGVAWRGNAAGTADCEAPFAGTAWYPGERRRPRTWPPNIGPELLQSSVVDQPSAFVIGGVETWVP